MIKQYTREDILNRIIKMGDAAGAFAICRADFVSQIWLLLEFAGFENLNGYGGFGHKLSRDKDILYDVNIEGLTLIEHPNDLFAKKVVEFIKKEYFDSNV